MRSIGAFVFFLGLGTVPSFANDLERAPPAFEMRGEKVIPVDFTDYKLTLRFNATEQKASGHAHIEFDAAQAGFPMMDMVPQPITVTLNGKDVGPENFVETNDPDHITKIRVLTQSVAANSKNILEIDYLLSSRELTFDANGVSVGFFMSDLDPRDYLERYAPSNFEFDQFPMTFDVEVEGAANDHTIFTNGDIEATGDHRWTVKFPSYFDASSFFFHLVPKDKFATAEETYKGIEQTFPITTYSKTQSGAKQAMESAKKELTELEATFGAFAHKKLVIYNVGSGNFGGMEYCGATMTDLHALGHELSHSWFARGVMPANGNAGWIDEAIASWRDANYPRTSEEPSLSPVNLGGFSPFRRHTTYAAYSSGKRLISLLDHRFADKDGMRAALRKLFAEKKRQQITVSFFQSFLEKFSGTSLAQTFDRFVYGKASDLKSVWEMVAPEPTYLKEQPIRSRGQVDWSAYR